MVKQRDAEGYMITVPEISVIVTVYNIKAYLEQCLNSLRNQTLTNIEIIVIDDGSSDGSSDICDEFAKEDLRFRVIHKQNEGLSAARNDGLDAAQADYIMFVDGDDWVEPKFCEAPYQIAKETGAEVIIFQRMWNDEIRAIRQDPFPEEGFVPERDVLTKLWDLAGVVTWNKLYHRRLFHGINYPIGKLSEDTAITHRIIHKAESIYLLNRCLYHHRIARPGSIMHERSNQMISDELFYNVLRVKDLRQWGYRYQIDEIKHALSYLIVLGRRAELSSLCDEIIRSADHEVIEFLPWKKKIAFHLYNLSLPAFDLIANLCGKRINTIS